MAKCSDPSCRRNAVVRGMCHSHYNRIIRGLKATGRIRAQKHREPVEYDRSAGCQVLGCGQPVAARGMCWGHYRRELRGMPLFVYLTNRGGKCSAVHFGPAKPSYRVLRMARFAWEIETNFTPEALTGCFLWTGEVYPTGYGHLGSFRDPWGGYAHRAALYFSGVALEPGRSKHVRHLCDNPACVNPRHLAYGTAADNAHDRSARWKREGKKWGTWLRPGAQGEQHSRAKLTSEQVTAMRSELAAGATMHSLAVRYGVADATVQSIKEGRTWRHLLPVPSTSSQAA